MDRTRAFFLTDKQAGTLAAAAECEWGRRVDVDPDPTEPERFLSAAQTLRRQQSPEYFGAPDEVVVTIAIPKRAWEWWSECYAYPISEMRTYLTEAQEADQE